MPRRSLLSIEQRTRLFAIPVDHAEMAKHYVLPYDDHNSWHRNAPNSFPKPLIERLQLSARPDEAGTFIGMADGTALPFLYASGSDDGFLDLAGWTDGLSVGPKSNNRFANLDQIDKLYNSATASEADPILQGSRFWYHAEVFDLPRLRRSHR